MKFEQVAWYLLLNLNGVATIHENCGAIFQDDDSACGTAESANPA